MKRSLVLTLTITVLSPLATAQNRESLDVIFDEPRRGEGTQILLGISELFASGIIAAHFSQEDQAVQTAKQQLRNAKEILTSEKGRKKTLDTLGENLDYFDVGMPHYTSLSERIHQVETSPILSEVEKTRAIDLAKNNLTSAREAAIKRAQSAGFLSKSIKVIRRGGILFLILDATARVYVWNALEADPTFSPAGNYIMHHLLGE